MLRTFALTLATLALLIAPAPAQDAFTPKFADFPASVSGELAVPDRVWPQRVGTTHKSGGVVGIVREVESPARLRGGFRSFEFPPLSPQVLSESGEPEYLEMLKDEKSVENITITKPGTGAWVYMVPPVEGKLKRSERNTANVTLRYSSLTPLGDGVYASDTTWFYYFAPAQSGAGTDAPPKRGLAVLMPGLLGTPEGPLTLLTTRLTQDGWGVLRMVAQPARFVEFATITIGDDTPASEAVAPVAKLAAERSAECAYAVQAAAAWIEAKNPEFATKPRAILGCSGGALTLPTVVARESERYGPCVLIGGGSNFFLMTLRTNYKHVTNVRYTFNTQPDEKRATELSTAYLQQSPLDSYFTATALKGKPVWFLSADSDYAVPTPLADLLWEQLGKPERNIMENASHELLFAQLPGYFDAIITFVRGE